MIEPVDASFTTPKIDRANGLGINLFRAMINCLPESRTLSRCFALESVSSASSADRISCCDFFEGAINVSEIAETGGGELVSLIGIMSIEFLGRACQARWTEIVQDW